MYTYSNMHLLPHAEEAGRGRGRRRGRSRRRGRGRRRGMGRRRGSGRRRGRGGGGVGEEAG